jgi:hypothetical protein
VSCDLTRRTPYAWMWQLGFERIVGNSETIPLIHSSRKTGFSEITREFFTDRV